MIQTKEVVFKPQDTNFSLKATFRRYIKPIFILCYVLPALNTLAQGQDALDSTIYYLNQLSGLPDKDSIVFDEIVKGIASFKPEYLLDKRYEDAMHRIKSNLKPEYYYTIAHHFLEHVIYNSTTDEYNYSIDYGLQHIKELLPNTNIPQKFIFLKTLRALRVPLRNSSRIYEGIETYSTFASHFQQRGDSASASIAYNVLASLYNTIGLADKSEYFQLKSIDFLDERIYPPDQTFLGYGIPPPIGLPGRINRKTVLASYLIDIGEYTRATQQLHEVFAMVRKIDSRYPFVEKEFLYLQMARVQVYLESDSAGHYFMLMRESLGDSTTNNFRFAHYFQEKSFWFYMEDKLDSAETNILKCIQIMKDKDFPATNVMGTLTPGYYLALIRIKQNRIKEAIAALQPEIGNLRALNLRRETLIQIKLLAEAYTLAGEDHYAAKAYRDYTVLSDEILEEEQNNRSISFEIEKRMAENEKAVQQLETENRYNQKRQYYLIGILSLLSLLALSLLTRNRYKQKVNKELVRKNKEIESTLTQLQSTQAQLVQSEKMASLGELTAGIAHEIQNPLNFINNFAEINTELIDEMKEELVLGHLAAANEIASTIKENEQKINHHGKRADAIVKGMLQHSRSSSGVKEPTNINTLADEYLRLAYHGLRAKDKSFNAMMNTAYDDTIGLVNIVPQDIGRVILNLITNAFYAVNEKQKLLSRTPSPLQTPNPLKGGYAYLPIVSVTTKKYLPLPGGRGSEESGSRESDGENGFIEISIGDNGSGIPPAILDKIFQPFFTTKPTGQGTGLGLSLSYDIVKAHGGELKVETKEGEGTAFIIQLPIK